MSSRVYKVHADQRESESSTHEQVDIVAATSPEAFVNESSQPQQQHAPTDSPAPRRHDGTEYVDVKLGSKLRPKLVFTIVRRIIIFAAAILYLETCLAACLDAIHVLRGSENPMMKFAPYKSPLVEQFVGSTTLRASPLIKTALDDDTSPRNGTIYLESGTASFTPCQKVVLPDRTYTDEFQRTIHAAVVRDTSFNLTFLDPSVNELIAPVVDCLSSPVVFGDDASSRFYYLTRMRANLDDVHLVIVTVSIQEYAIPAQNEYGAASVSTVVAINDLRANDVTHHFVLALGYPFKDAPLEVFTLDGVTPDTYWRLRSVPRDPLTSYSKLVLTTCRTGFYLSSENEQSNIRNALWDLSSDPLTVISTWQWRGRPMLRDSWAWVHFIHLLLAVDISVTLLVLLVVIYHNFRAGKIWFGDAFVAVSNTLWLRSSLVVISWWVSGFWSLTEFCLNTGNVLANNPGYFVYPAIIRADLLALYFCFIGLIGNVCKERIDPALTIGLFYISFEGRVALTKLFRGFYDKAVAYSIYEYSLAMTEVDPELESISPLRHWTPHPTPKRDSAFIMAILVPVFSTFVVAITYVAMCKVYRVFVPDKLLVQRVTGVSEDEERLLELKRNLTMFEIATGAALQNHYGIVADYTNCLYIKGIKYASADGVYSSGYVVANGKFLIQTEDLVTIWLMKLLRRRFRNVYVYDVSDTTVKQQARLVYPETMTVADLVNLNVDNLA